VKLILQREVGGLGAAGEIVEVADGYGRNYLVPRGDAIAWSKGAEKQIGHIKRARDAREIRGRDHAQEVKETLETLSVTLSARAGTAWRGKAVRLGHPGRQSPSDQGAGRTDVLTASGSCCHGPHQVEPGRIPGPVDLHRRRR
jgi:hypothetical protein